MAAERSAELLVYPENVGHWVPLSPAWTLALVWAFRVLLVGALLGFQTQACLVGLSLLGIPLLAAAQLLGPTVHNMHLLWFLLLLAAAPSGQVWSFDSLFRRRTHDDALVVLSAKDARLAPRAAQALLIARLLLACIYFFPGAWKVGANGLSWASPQRLIPLFHSKWYQFDFVPSLRVDEHPALLQWGGMAIMALELAFPLLVMTRLGRWTAFVSGLTFHVLSAQFLGIRFMPLWLCYGILIDWPQVLDWLHDRSSRSPRELARQGWLERLRSFRVQVAHLNLVSVLGAVLLTGAMVQGARGQMQSWPFACYPTFHGPVADTLPDVLLVVSTPAGNRAYPSPRQARLRSQAAWGRTWDLLGYYGTPVSPARLHAYAQEHLARLDPTLTNAQVTLYEVERSTRPSAWDSAPRVVRRLGTVPFTVWPPTR